MHHPSSIKPPGVSLCTADCSQGPSSLQNTAAGGNSADSRNPQAHTDKTHLTKAQRGFALQNNALVSLTIARDRGANGAKTLPVNLKQRRSRNLFVVRYD